MMNYKKILIITLIIIFTASSGAITFAYMSEVEILNYSVELKVNDQRFYPQKSSLHIPFVSNLPFKKLDSKDEYEPYDLGDLDSLPVFTFQDSFTSDMAVFSDDGKKIFEGTDKSYKDLRIINNGDYSLIVSINTPKSENSRQGNALFQFSANINLSPNVIISSNKVVQGDILSINVINVPSGITPTIFTDIGVASFIENDGEYRSVIPVDYLKPIGNYKINITVDGITSEHIVEIIDGNFKEQYLTIDTSNPVISEANSPEAYQEFRDIISPLFETSDKTRYWSRPFTMPVQGPITTEFGQTRYTNGSSKPSGHGALDIAAIVGTPVLAPAPGRVVYSGYLLNTGNTVVIEHGDGLKSYYYHMNARNVNKEDMVKQEQQIGEVGNTGYSTGPHLHFEVKMGKQSINPWNLINGEGEFFK